MNYYIIINRLEIPGILNSKQTMLNSLFQGMKSSLKFSLALKGHPTYARWAPDPVINGLINPINGLRNGMKWVRL